MPDRQEKFDLVQWVEGLPTREGLKGFQEVLGYCAGSYGNTPADLLMVIRHYMDSMRRAMTQQVHRYQAVHDHTMPPTEELGVMYDKVMEAVLLRMFLYSSEYYQRYVGPDVFKALDDNELIGLFGEGEKE